MERENKSAVKAAKEGETRLACAMCAFFVCDTPGASVGHCRRFPPEIGSVAAGQKRITGPGGDRPVPIPISFFPPTQASHWCGEFMPPGGAVTIKADATKDMEDIEPGPAVVTKLITR